VLAKEAARLGAWLVHYSTDYVFNGGGDTAWVETDTPSPLNVYGATKLEGETLIAAANPRHLIFRTSWVYAARGGNFAKTMLRLAQERDKLTVINDQIGAPTGADLLADVTAHAIRQVLQQKEQVVTTAGLFHLVAGGETSWFEYAKHVLAQAQLVQPAIKIRATQVLPVPTSAFPTQAERPHNSRLNTVKLQRTFGLTLPPWQAGVNRMLAEIL
jgi:dTDP-4-dehydrorhamnose reductase